MLTNQTVDVTSGTPTVATPTVAEHLARVIATCAPQSEPLALEVARRLVLDISGLCVAASHEPYVKAALAAVDQAGPCSVIGSDATLGAEGAAFVNGTAAHGEDFDDTYEGGPVHAGAVVVPAVLAAVQRHGLAGSDLLRGIAIGAELMCRLCAVAPMKVHKAGFHPTAIFGVMGAVAGAGAALRVDEKVLVNALGIAGSMASGIIEYLAEGAWTKRLHPGWAAQSGYRALRLAMAGFHGPRSVFEGRHGFFHGYANTSEGNFAALLDGFGERWLWTTIAFKPYACGTMAHPYIDCARAFRKRGIDVQRIERIECKTAEGIVHRLWEPLAAKRAPQNGYAAKFSIPYAIAVALLRDNAGLGEYADAQVGDPALLALAAKISYIVDPHNPYPRQFTGHIKVTLNDGKVHEHCQSFFKGGVEHPLTDTDLEHKFFANCAYAGLARVDAQALAARLRGLFELGLVDARALAAPPAQG
ncbi:MAG: MmgE/PrpD family protein [Burkholderiaceae bacterium]